MTRLLLLTLAWMTFNSVAQAELSFKKACTDSETWVFDESIRDDFQKSFQQFIQKRLPAIRGFGEALALRRMAKTQSEKAFAEYWVSRSFWTMEMVHLSHRGFEFLLASSESLPIQQASAVCLSEILKRVPTLGISKALISKLLKLPQGPENQELVLRVIFDRVGEKETTLVDLRSYAKYFVLGSVYQNLGLALIAAREQKHDDLILNMRAAFSSGDFAKFASHEDPLRLLLARSLFAKGDFDSAALELLKVKKTSNELSHALQELTWAYLRNYKYKEAIGTASNLQTGGLKNTFAPEAGLVMAISLNELCHYPESLHAMNNLKKDYKEVFEWLQKWSSQKDKVRLYSLALGFLKKEQGVPIRVAGEWLRSPLFLSRQEEINSFFNQKRAVDLQQEIAAVEVRKMAADLLKFLKEFKPIYLKARSEVPIGGTLPDYALRDLETFKTKIAHYRRLQRAAIPWQKMSAFSVQQNIPREQKLLSDIEKDLKRINSRMYSQLLEVAEDSHFLEVEIFQGASQDIVWKNAHPEFEEYAKKFDANKEKSQKNFGHVYDWGKVGTILGENQEVWEDELGSYRADLADQCSNRDQFLNEKRKKDVRSL